VSGQLLVRDLYKPTPYLATFLFFAYIYNTYLNPLLCSIPAEKAYVGLALPGNAGSWQKECKVQYEFEPMGFNSLNFKGLAGDGLR